MAETLARLFRHAVSYDKPDMMLTKEGGAYQPLSAQEVYRRVGRLHLKLKAVGVQRGDRCALLSENRWEWAVADFAMVTAGIVNVPLYPTLSAEQVCHMLEHSESRVLFVSTQEQLDKALSLWKRLPRLEGIVAFDAVRAGDERVIQVSKLIGEEPLTPDEKNEFEAVISSVEAGELASILYTSGTTGVPKGVMLNHGNFAAGVQCHGYEVHPDDVCLSFLPLCHVAERVADYIYFYNGATVAYAESLEKVAENLIEVHPTVAAGVPRFFEKIQAKALAAVESASPLRRKLFHWALGVGMSSMPYRLKRQPLPPSLRWRYLLADRLVFSKLRGRLGGRMRFFVSGAAPLPKHVAEFFYAAGITVCEAYGLTETTALISANLPDDLRFGTVGKPVQGIEIKIAGDGEILVRGPNIMPGYFKMEAETQAAFADGWFRTGDIGRFDEDGFLAITDRKNDLFKTSGGKFIAPQPIENQLKVSAFISMAVVVAEGRHFPSALIVPNFERLEKFAAEQGLAYTDRADLARHEKVRQMIEQEVQNACADLAHFERIKKISLLDRELSIENGEMTPSMKIRRRAVEARFSDLIEQMYK